MVLDGLCSDCTLTFCLEFVQGCRVASKCHHPNILKHFWGLPVQVDKGTNGRSWERTNVARLRGVVIDQGRWWKVKYHEKAFSYRLQRQHFSFPVLYSITGHFWKYQVRTLPHMRRICGRDLTSAWWTEWKWCRKKWNWVEKMAAAICWSIVHFTVVCFCWLDCLQVFSSARRPSGNKDVRAAC